MKQFKGFVIKEFYHIFRDYRSLIIMFGIPIAQTLIFGFALNLDIRNADIAIIDFAKQACMPFCANCDEICPRVRIIKIWYA